jgi:hypothetical protein
MPTKLITKEQLEKLEQYTSGFKKDGECCAEAAIRRIEEYRTNFKSNSFRWAKISGNWEIIKYISDDTFQRIGSETIYAVSYFSDIQFGEFIDESFRNLQ